jgi:hypothetical protein
LSCEQPASSRLRTNRMMRTPSPRARTGN